jgi:alpha-1,6-mannosyltransferase
LGLKKLQVDGKGRPLVFDLHLRPERSFRGPEIPGSAWVDPEAECCGSPPHLVDTTMLYAPRSGGVKRYLNAKCVWFHRHRPGVRHTLVVPGDETARGGGCVMTIAAARLPFGGGYRWPTLTGKWAEHLTILQPDVIEAGDPYGPGRAALEAGDRVGAPVVGFCHSDPAALAALHLGEWAEPPVRRRWARLFRRFDRVVAPSRHIAERLAYAGVQHVSVQPLGVDIDLFHPSKAERDGVRRRLGLGADVKLLVFAGRAAREKNIDVLLDAVAKLGPGYHLMLVGAGALAKPQANATFLDYVCDPREVARLLASCDAFVHANDREPFGLVALEAMACGLPIVGVASGGIGELVDQDVGQLAARATPAAFAEAVTALFERDVHAVGQAARRRAESRHSWDATFQNLSSLYGELCGVPARSTIATTPHRPQLQLVPSF